MLRVFNSSRPWTTAASESPPAGLTDFPGSRILVGRAHRRFIGRPWAEPPSGVDCIPGDRPWEVGERTYSAGSRRIARKTELFGRLVLRNLDDFDIDGSDLGDEREAQIGKTVTLE